MMNSGEPITGRRRRSFSTAGKVMAAMVSNSASLASAHDKRTV
jgi:hypothetical protein